MQRGRGAQPEPLPESLPLDFPLDLPEPLPPPQRVAASSSYDIESLLFIAFGLVVVVGGMLRALLGRFPAAVLMGGALGVLAWATMFS